MSIGRRPFSRTLPSSVGVNPGQAEADLLIRQLESQLRRQRDEPLAPAAFSAAVRRWAVRFGQALPALAGEAGVIADTFQTGDQQSTVVPLESIGKAMRMLARLRSLMAGETPHQVVLPGASGPPPARTADPVVPASSGRASPPASPAVSGQPVPPLVARNGPAPTVAPGGPIVASKPQSGKIATLSEQTKGTANKRPPARVQKSETFVAPPDALALESAIEGIPRFDKRYAAPLTKLRIRTVGDLLRHYPRRYLDYSELLPIAQLRPGAEVTIEAVVQRCEAVGPFRGPGRRVEATFADSTGTIRGIWFGQSWRVRQLKPGLHLYVSGKVDAFGGRLQFSHPDYEEVTEKEAIHTGRLVPVYPLSGELTAQWLRGRMKWAIDHLVHTVLDPLPGVFRQHWRLSPLHAALQQIHYPDDEAELQAARRRIAFDDLFLLQLGLLKQKRQWQHMQAVPLPLPEGRLAEFVAQLPFTLTAAQQLVLGEVLADVSRTVPMGRLLQGDVGSGKTVIAALAALAAVEYGCQAAVVAPTEILAEQHARTLAALFAEMLPMLKPVLITGSMTARARAEARKQIASGQAAVVVGTHALFSEREEFARLALVVIDEQHRFGVYQRDTLWRKGERPHLLAMTATPIPRTLALQKFGDLDLSVIDELPAGRQVIKTRYAAPEKRDAVYQFLHREVSQGRQAYIICPLVDESDVLAAKAVTTEYKRLHQDIFPDLRLGLLHGRMKPGEKDEAMRRFRDGETQVLVATTVIEVGVDVPNASIMLIEGAERFGLAQLHQLRGRVGRGAHQSYCVLMASEAVDEPGEHRLRLVEATSDGFALAEEDLKLRRTGSFFGSEQSGDEWLLRWAAFADPAEARQAAEALLTQDPDLTQPEHALLAERVKTLLARQRADAGVADVEDGVTAEQETASLAYV